MVMDESNHEASVAVVEEDNGRLDRARDHSVGDTTNVFPLVQCNRYNARLNDLIPPTHLQLCMTTICFDKNLRHTEPSK